MTGTKEDNGGNPALRRALIRTKPEYFSWPVEEQEKYGLTLPKTEDFRIRQSIVKDLFGIEVATEADLEVAFQDFGDADYLKFNSAILPLRGIGENYFFLNEYFGDKTLLDFETLHDYCYDDHLFQEAAKKQDIADYQPKPYRGSLYHSWARLIVDGAFFYADLCSLADHLFSYLDDLGLDTIQSLIPHEYVEGKNHGKREGKGTLRNFKPDAKGLEGQLEELKFRHYKYVEKRYEFLADLMDQEATKKVYMTKRKDSTDPQIDFVFSDQTALKAVRFQYFMQDCEAITGDIQELQRLQAEEHQALTAYLEQQHKEIMENFDPKVVKLRKKYKIVVADGAFDGLW